MIANRRTCLLAAAALGLAGALSAPAAAQERFPSRQMTIIVPAPPGGGTDTFARQLAEIMEPTLGQKVVVENRGGGGGTVGVTLFTQARPDGHTLLLTWSGPITATPHTLQVAYTPDSYAPVYFIGNSAYILCAKDDFAASPAEFLDKLRQAPGRYTYGNDGIGGSGHLAVERAFRALNVSARAVPFQGSGETVRNFLGGHVTFYSGSITTILPHVQAGTARCHLLSSREDNMAIPAAAGLQRLGVPQAETNLWWGVFAPRGLPADRQAFLHRAFSEAAQNPRFQETLRQQGVTPKASSPAEFDAMLRAEYAALGELARGMGLQRRAQ